MSIYIKSEAQRTNLHTLILMSLFIGIFAGLQAACFDSNQKTTATARENELREKENLKIQREESLKLFGAKLDEFVKLAPPTKLAPQPYLKGKAVIVDLGNEGYVTPFYYGYNLTDPEIKLVYPQKSTLCSEKEKSLHDCVEKEFWNETKEIWNKTFAVKSIAEKTDDIQTVIQLKFTGTNVCRRYGSTDFFKGASLCGVKAEVTVIDKTIPAIIAKKTFTNNKLPEKVEVIEPLGNYESPSIKDSHQMYPFTEIEEYLKNLEQK